MDRYLEFKCRCTKNGAKFKTVLYCAYCLLFADSGVSPPFSSEAVKMLIKKGVFKNSFEYDAFVMECKDDDSDYKIYEKVADRAQDIFLTKKQWKMVQDSAKGWVSYYAGPENASKTIQRCTKCKTEIEVLDYYA